MTIKFRCECGRVLMAPDEKAGQEGQCPACGQVMRIPRADEAGAGEAEGAAPSETFDERTMGEETPAEAEGFEDLEGEDEDEMGGEPEKRSWYPSSRLAILASALVVVAVALIVLLFVRREKQPSQEVVVIKKIEPPTETEAEPKVRAVGTELEKEEAVSPIQPEESEPTVSPMIEEGSVEEPLAGLQGQAEPVEEEAAAGEEQPQVVASTAAEAPPAPEVPKAEKMPQPGTFVINVASFRQRQSAKRYVEKLKQEGIDAFEWKVDLPQKGRWYRVSVGGFSNRQEAEKYANELSRKGLSDMFITRIPGTS